MKKITTKSIIIFILFFFIETGFCLAQKKLDVESMDDAIGVVMSYDKNNNLIGTGSCFCVDPSGIFYSSYRYLKNAHHSEVRLGNGEIYKINKITGVSETKDLIKFQVKKIGSKDLPFLEIEKKETKKGSDAVTIIPPYNANIMDRYAQGYIYGIYSDDITGAERFKVSKNLAVFNSGNPVINAYGRVIGITSQSNSFVQNSEYIDYAIGIHEFDKLKTTNFIGSMSDESLNLFNHTIFISNPATKNDVALFIDESYYGVFEQNTTEEKPNCDNENSLKVKLTEGSHNYIAIENSTGFAWTGEININKDDGCKSTIISNSLDKVNKKINLDRYNETGVSMNRSIEINDLNSTTNTNQAGSSFKSGNSTFSKNKPLDNFKNYFRFDAGFEHQNFMAHNGWPTYSLALQFEKNFEDTPFSRNYRISVGMNDSSYFYLHMPAGPIAGIILLMFMSGGDNNCTGIAASTLLFILPDGFAFSPIQKQNMEFSIYANFLGVDFCQTKRNVANPFYSLDYAPDFGARFNYYFNDKLYFTSRLSAKYSTLFAGWGAQGTIGIGFEFAK